jgi:hypothetical protein
VAVDTSHPSSDPGRDGQAGRRATALMNALGRELA